MNTFNSSLKTDLILFSTEEVAVWVSISVPDTLSEAGDTGVAFVLTKKEKLETFPLNENSWDFMNLSDTVSWD